MKKTVFALAALAALASISTTANAQSSVTIYALVDTSLTYTSKVGTDNRSRFSIDSGDLAPRFQGQGRFGRRTVHES